AASKVDRRAQRLVEPCRVLGQDDVEFAALGIEPLLAAESGLNGAESVRDECGFEAQCASGCESGDGVIGVIEAAERKLDADAADAQRDAVESVQLAVGRGPVGCRPG